MDYSEAMGKIDSLLVFGSKPGLDRISKLLSLMGDPQNELRIVHVAGTNGKGSVCNMLAGVLREAGYKTGLFTSPHIVCFGERMQINGEYIPECDVCALVEEIFPLVEKMRENGEIITEFEFVAAMAFRWFYREKCDVVVLEVGMGGRFDATNVIKTPLCSIITSISLDHTAILGDTLAKIAFEKSGIIKQGGRTVFALQQSEVNAVILQVAKERKNKVHIADTLHSADMSLKGTVVKYEGTSVVMPLLGKHQLLNLALVFAAVNALRLEGYNITTNSVKAGVAGVKIPARFEMLSEKPLIIADGAHNPDGMRMLSSAIHEYLGNKKVICVLGMLRDKECFEAVKHLQGEVIKLMVTTVPDSPRSQTAQELCSTLDGLFIKKEAYEDPKQALDAALNEAEKTPRSAVLICGSLYLASALRGYIIKYFK